ncbi:MAG: alpha/beta fold hydrolase [Polyangiaceae bacterium]
MPSVVAPPLVLLAGASGNTTAWEPIRKRLEKRRLVLTPEYPGLGNAPARPDLGSLDEVADWLLLTLPPRFDLCALSMGGSLALRWALTVPDRVRRLVLVASAGGVDARRLGGLDWREAFRCARPHAPGYFVEDATHYDDELRSLGIPTLLVFGDEDLVAPPAVAQYLRERLPDAKLELIPEASHDIEAEFPDWVASAIEAHLRR